MVLGGGPNRIGQGIEFDYCCVHAAMALREDGYETIMVNCNPETVSTDYDTSDRLYFEPLTLEDVLEIVHVEKPLGVIVQFGGQTPLKLARDLEANGVPIIGTSPDMIDMAEDRERFQQLLHRLGLQAAAQPHRAHRGRRRSPPPTRSAIRWSCGRRTCSAAARWRSSTSSATSSATCARRSRSATTRRCCSTASSTTRSRSTSTRSATAREVVIGGIMEHIEQAGVHSGDSACSLPPYSLSPRAAGRAAPADGGDGAGPRRRRADERPVRDPGRDVVYVLEVNPRASRTVPFVSKATGRPLAKIAARCMVGQTLAAQGVAGEIVPPYFSVKEAVFPFIKFPGVDTILGPEMKSTGEVMGVGETFGEAFVKSPARRRRASCRRRAACSSACKNGDKPRAVEIARMLAELGFTLVATRGTAAALAAAGVPVDAGQQGAEGRPHIVDMIKNDEIALVVNTVEEKRAAIQDSYQIRRAALTDQVPTYTTHRRRPRRGDRHAGDARARPVRDAGAARAAALTPAAGRTARPSTCRRRRPLRCRIFRQATER